MKKFIKNYNLIASLLLSLILLIISVLGAYYAKGSAYYAAEYSSEVRDVSLFLSVIVFAWVAWMVGFSAVKAYKYELSSSEYRVLSRRSLIVKILYSLFICYTMIRKGSGDMERVLHLTFLFLVMIEVSFRWFIVRYRTFNEQGESTNSHVKDKK